MSCADCGRRQGFRPVVIRSDGSVDRLCAKCEEGWLAAGYFKHGEPVWTMSQIAARQSALAAPG